MSEFSLFWTFLLFSAIVQINAYNFTCGSDELISTKNFGSRKWPNGVIKYELHSSLSASDRTQVQAAFNVYHSKTCLRFEPRSAGEAAYVSIEYDPNTCGLAHVCRTGGYQFAKFGGSCRNAAVMVHELGHTICFGHEQTRKDRDSYVRFPCGNPPGRDDSFDTLGMLYDYKSSMHYGCDSCLVPTKSGVTTSDCGQDNLSVLDVQKINAFYDCPGCLGYRFRPIATLTGGEQADLLPGGAGISGQVHVCRAYHNGDIIPGSANVQGGTCYVAFGGQEFGYSGGEVITKARAGSRLVWRAKPSNNVIPGNAIPGGRTRTGETLYIGRAIVHNGAGQASYAVGKVHAGRPDIAFLPFNGREHQVRSFEFLQCE